MNKFILTLLVIPLIIVLATKSPEAAGHLAAMVVTAGAKLLNGVAGMLNTLLGGH